MSRSRPYLLIVLLAAWGCTPSPPTASDSGASLAQVVEIDAGGTPMVLLPGGEFTMGDDAAGGAHPVRVTAFAIDKFEVTQQQFADLELPNPSKFKDSQRPADQIRWTEAAKFCNERSRAAGLEPCYDETTFACNFEASGYRLPTEAEWEYAARGGDPRPLAAADIPRAACYQANSSGRTDRVGQRRPNGWGLHDMLGNVAEWCNDVFAEVTIKQSIEVDPTGPAEGKLRVIRGGSYQSPIGDVSPTIRLGDIPGIVDACIAKSTYGFRCVRRWTTNERETHPEL